MTKRELVRHQNWLSAQATELAGWVVLSPQNAAVWRAEAAKFQALADAIKADIQSGRYEPDGTNASVPDDLK